MQYNSASISWKNIDWFNGTIKVRGKGEEKIKYINDNPKIRISSGDEKPAAKWNFDTEDLIVHYICDTIISKVRKVLKAAGMYVHGRAVHAFRHTFATETLKNNNIRVT